MATPSNVYVSDAPFFLVCRAPGGTNLALNEEFQGGLSEYRMLVVPLSTTMASLGTFVAFVPAQMGSKPVPAVFSSLREVCSITFSWGWRRSRSLLEIIHPDIGNTLTIRVDDPAEDLMISIS